MAAYKIDQLHQYLIVRNVKKVRHIPMGNEILSNFIAVPPFSQGFKLKFYCGSEYDIVYEGPLYPTYVSIFPFLLRSLRLAIPIPTHVRAQGK